MHLLLLVAATLLCRNANALAGSYADVFVQRAMPAAGALSPQITAFGPLVNRSLTSSPFTVSAVTTSGLPATFASLTAPVCSVSGSTVALLAVGTCTIRASQGGNATYAPAPNVDQSFSVTTAAQTVTFASAAAYPVGTYPEAIAFGDFNGDGVADLAVANAFSSSVSILFGRSDGTFTSGPSVLSGGIPIAVAAGDFNRDGKLDLAVCDFSSGTVVILAGLGNGTFVRLGAFASGLYPDAIAVSDVDIDGKLDLIVTNGTSGSVTGQTVSVLLGNGDGSFRPPVSYTTGASPYAVVAADFNKDGKPDLAVANGGNNTVSILKGIGDGTFAPAVSYPTGTFPDGLAAGDFNEDGNIDLAVVNDYSNNVSILLGHGDGTFGTTSNFVTGSGSASVAVADFNGDGHSDLAVVNRFDNNVIVLLGNGNGSFQAPLSFGVGGAPGAIVARDLNGDGRPDLALTSTANNNVSVLLQTAAAPTSLVAQAGTPQSAVVNTVYLTPLKVLVRDAGSLPIAGVPITFTAPATGPSGTFGTAGTLARVSSDASGVAVAPALTANATAGPFTVTASIAALNAAFALTNTSSSANLPPVFTSAPPGSGMVNTPYNFNLAASGIPAPMFSALPSSLPTGLSLNATSGLIAGTPSAQGTFAGTFTASNGIPPNATQPFAITIAGMTQTISFTPLGNRPLGSPPFALSATASSGLAVSFSSQTSAVCTVTASNVSLSTTGTCTIRAIQAGNASYAPAATVDQSFQVTAPNQPPAVALISPANNSFYVSPALVPLYATASDPDGSIARVEFYNGSALLGTSTKAPYTFSWPGVLAGSYALTAKAYDNQGASKTSSVTNITIGAAGQHISFVRSADVQTGYAPNALVIGDFNGDAKLDIAVAHTGGSAADVEVLRGDGAGGFLTAGDYVSGAGSGAIKAAIATDFSGDGKLDFATAKAGGFVVVQLGTATGGLAGGVSYPLGRGTHAIAYGDFNGDGKVDLVTANDDGGLSMLIGNGDGTFRSAVNLPVGSEFDDNIAVADFNGDGKLDIVLTQPIDDSILILLGKGDGSFQPAARIATGSFPSQPNEVVVGDFNGDGKVDIAFSNLFNPNVSILVGNGDGTFQPSFDYPTGGTSHGRGIVAADFDGDGKLDLAVANTNDNTLAILLGNGNGSFQSPVTIALGPGPFHVVAGDFNGDGAPDVAVSYTTGTTISIVTNVSKLVTQAPAFSNGRPPDGEAGARYDFNFTATGVPHPVFALSTSPFFATMQPNGLLTTGVPGSSGCPCPGLYSGTAIASNGIVPDATQSFSILIRRRNQTITFDALPDLPAGATSFLNATASSNGSVTLSSLTPDICSLDISSPPTVDLKALRPGSCIIRAEQAGNGYFAPAPTVDRSFTVSSTGSGAYFSVAISSPADGANFVAPATVVIKAIATNGYVQSHVQKVDYYHDGSVPIGTSTIAPYAITWGNVLLGTHVITARATVINDVNGLVAGYADAPPITIAVTSSADQPVVALTSPSTNNRFFAPASIALAATATDTLSPINRVEFYSGANLIGVKTSAPYAMTWDDVPGGIFALTACAVNGAGAATTSAPVVVSVDPAIPTVVASYTFDDAWASTGYVRDIVGGFDGIPQGSVTVASAAAVPPKPDTCQSASFSGGTVDTHGLPVPKVAAAKTTVAFWLNWNGGDGAMPLSWPTQGLLFSAGSFGFTTLNNDVYGIASGSLANGWHHVVAEFTNGGVGANRLHVDGALQTLTQRVGVPNLANATIDGSLRIGGRSNAADHRFIGLLDELQLFQGALSTAQVGAIYSTASPCATLRVSLMAPLQGAEYAAPATIEMVAAPLSRQASVARVDFYNGATLIGSSSFPPYAFTWTNVAPGSFSLTAKATDISSVSATSTAIGVRVVARAPDVQLTTPLGGTIFTKGDKVNIAAAASETGGSIARVDFMAEGAVIGTKTQPPYQLEWDPPPAVFNTSYDLTARATDARGASTATRATRIFIITDQIAVNLTAPASNAVYTSPTPIPLSASAVVVKPGDSVAKVDFYCQLGCVNRLIGTTTTSPYGVTWSGFGAGTYDLYAQATGSLGTVGTSQVVRINVIGDKSPVVALTAPINAAQYTAPATIPLAAIASDPDGSVAKVDFYAGATLLGTRTAPPYSMNWSSVGVGSYTLSAKATDNLGVSAFSAPISVSVSASTAPTIAITAPQTGAQYAKGQPIVLIASAATPGRTIDRVEFYADAVLLRAAPVAGGVSATSVTFTWSSGGVGAHGISAKVFATDGTNATSAGVNVTVADLSVTLTAPFTGQVYQSPEAVRISASPGANGVTISQVDFIGDGALLGNVKAAPYSFLWSGAGVGTHTVSATARTTGGLAASSPSSSITVVAAPTVAIDAGINGSTVADDNVSISGTLQGPINSAVGVNGQLAALDRNGRFYLDGVPLQPGSNTLTVTVDSQDAAPVIKTITVNRSGQAPFAVNVTPVLGLAPLGVQITITNRGNIPFQRIEIDANSDGAPDLMLTSLPGNEATVSLNYTNPGLYSLRVTVFDASSTIIYTATRKILARDPRDLAGLVTQVFTGMLDRLHAGNVAGALNAVTTTVRTKYQNVFSVLGARLPSILDSSFGVVTTLSVTEEFADLTIVRTKPDGQHGYHVLLIRDGDGLWRIDNM